MDTVTSENLVARRLHWGRGRIAFVANHEHIKNMLDQGYSQRNIYQSLQDHLNGLSYAQFSYHVRKYFKRRVPVSPQEPAKQPAESPKDQRSPTRPNSPGSPQTTAIRGYQPGPKDPDLKDLF